MPASLPCKKVTIARLTRRNGVTLTVGPFSSTMEGHEWRSSFNEECQVRRIGKVKAFLDFVPNTTACDIDPQDATGIEVAANLEHYCRWKGQANIWRVIPPDNEEFDLLLELCSVLGLQRVNEVNALFA